MLALRIIATEFILLSKACARKIQAPINTYDFLAGLGAIDKIPEQDDFTMAGKTTSWDGSGGLLQGHLLVVAVDGLFRVDVEGSFGGARGTASDRDLCL